MAGRAVMRRRGSTEVLWCPWQMRTLTGMRGGGQRCGKMHCYLGYRGQVSHVGKALWPSGLGRPLSAGAQSFVRLWSHSSERR